MIVEPGVMIGDVLVLKKSEKKRHYSEGTYWICQCPCGNEMEITRSRLVNQRKISCGCTRSPYMKIGDVFGELTLKEKVGQNKHKNAIWLCVCSCGKEKEITNTHLRSGTRSCGCLNKRLNSANKSWEGVGDISATVFYKIVKHANSRNIVLEIDINYVWEIFLQQDRKCALTKQLLKFPKSNREVMELEILPSLDRIDSSKGYIKGNVQWVEKKVNYMKQAYSQEEFINICKMVATNN